MRLITLYKSKVNQDSEVTNSFPNTERPDSVYYTNSINSPNQLKIINSNSPLLPTSNKLQVHANNSTKYNLLNTSTIQTTIENKDDILLSRNFEKPLNISMNRSDHSITSELQNTTNVVTQSSTAETTHTKQLNNQGVANVFQNAEVSPRIESNNYGSSTRNIYANNNNNKNNLLEDSNTFTLDTYNIWNNQNDYTNFKIFDASANPILDLPYTNGHLHMDSSHLFSRGNANAMLSIFPVINDFSRIDQFVDRTTQSNQETVAESSISYNPSLEIPILADFNVGSPPLYSTTSSNIKYAPKDVFSLLEPDVRDFGTSEYPMHPMLGMEQNNMKSKITNEFVKEDRAAIAKTTDQVQNYSGFTYPSTKYTGFFITSIKENPAVQDYTGFTWPTKFNDLIGITTYPTTKFIAFQNPVTPAGQQGIDFNFNNSTPGYFTNNGKSAESSSYFNLPSSHYTSHNINEGIVITSPILVNPSTSQSKDTSESISFSTNADLSESTSSQPDVSALTTVASTIIQTQSPEAEQVTTTQTIPTQYTTISTAPSQEGNVVMPSAISSSFTTEVQSTTKQLVTSPMATILNNVLASISSARPFFQEKFGNIMPSGATQLTGDDTISLSSQTMQVSTDTESTQLTSTINRSHMPTSATDIALTNEEEVFHNEGVAKRTTAKESNSTNGNNNSSTAETGSNKTITTGTGNNEITNTGTGSTKTSTIATASDETNISKTTSKGTTITQTTETTRVTDEFGEVHTIELATAKTIILRKFIETDEDEDEDVIENAFTNVVQDFDEDDNVIDQISTQTTPKLSDVEQNTTQATNATDSSSTLTEESSSSKTIITSSTTIFNDLSVINGILSSNALGESSTNISTGETSASGVSSSETVISSSSVTTLQQESIITEVHSISSSATNTASGGTSTEVGALSSSFTSEGYSSSITADKNLSSLESNTSPSINMTSIIGSSETETSSGGILNNSLLSSSVIPKGSASNASASNITASSESSMATTFSMSSAAVVSELQSSLPGNVITVQHGSSVTEVPAIGRSETGISSGGISNNSLSSSSVISQGSASNASINYNTASSESSMSTTVGFSSAASVSELQSSLPTNVASFQQGSSVIEVSNISRSESTTLGRISNNSLSSSNVISGGSASNTAAGKNIATSESSIATSIGISSIATVQQVSPVPDVATYSGVVAQMSPIPTGVKTSIAKIGSIVHLEMGSTNSPIISPIVAPTKTSPINPPIIESSPLISFTSSIIMGQKATSNLNTLTNINVGITASHQVVSASVLHGSITEASTSRNQIIITNATPKPASNIVQFIPSTTVGPSGFVKTTAVSGSEGPIQIPHSPVLAITQPATQGTAMVGLTTLPQQTLLQSNALITPGASAVGTPAIILHAGVQSVAAGSVQATVGTSTLTSTPGALLQNAMAIPISNITPVNPLLTGITGAPSLVSQTGKGSTVPVSAAPTKILTPVGAVPISNTIAANPLLAGNIASSSGTPILITRLGEGSTVLVNKALTETLTAPGVQVSENATLPTETSVYQVSHSPGPLQMQSPTNGVSVILLASGTTALQHELVSTQSGQHAANLSEKPTTIQAPLPIVGTPTASGIASIPAMPLGEPRTANISPQNIGSASMPNSGLQTSSQPPELSHIVTSFTAEYTSGSLPIGITNVHKASSASIGALSNETTAVITTNNNIANQTNFQFPINTDLSSKGATATLASNKSEIANHSTDVNTEHDSSPEKTLLPSQIFQNATSSFLGGTTSSRESSSELALSNVSNPEVPSGASTTHVLDLWAKTKTPLITEITIESVSVMQWPQTEKPTEQYITAAATGNETAPTSTDRKSQTPPEETSELSTTLAAEIYGSSEGNKSTSNEILSGSELSSTSEETTLETTFASSMVTEIGGESSSPDNTTTVAETSTTLETTTVVAETGNGVTSIETTTTLAETGNKTTSVETTSVSDISWNSEETTLSENSQTESGQEIVPAITETLPPISPVEATTTSAMSSAEISSSSFTPESLEESSNAITEKLPVASSVETISTSESGQESSNAITYTSEELSAIPLSDIAVPSPAPEAGQESSVAITENLPVALSVETISTSESGQESSNAITYTSEELSAIPLSDIAVSSPAPEAGQESSVAITGNSPVASSVETISTSESGQESSNATTYTSEELSAIPLSEIGVPSPAPEADQESSIALTGNSPVALSVETVSTSELGQESSNSITYTSEIPAAILSSEIAVSSPAPETGQESSIAITGNLPVASSVETDNTSESGQESSNDITYSSEIPSAIPSSEIAVPLSASDVGQESSNAITENSTIVSSVDIVITSTTSETDEGSTFGPGEVTSEEIALSTEADAQSNNTITASSTVTSEPVQETVNSTTYISDKPPGLSLAQWAGTSPAPETAQESSNAITSGIPALSMAITDAITTFESGQESTFMATTISSASDSGQESPNGTHISTTPPTISLSEISITSSAPEAGQESSHGITVNSPMASSVEIAIESTAPESDQGSTYANASIPLAEFPISPFTSESSQQSSPAIAENLPITSTPPADIAITSTGSESGEGFTFATTMEPSEGREEVVALANTSISFNVSPAAPEGSNVATSPTLTIQGSSILLNQHASSELLSTKLSIEPLASFSTSTSAAASEEELLITATEITGLSSYTQTSVVAWDEFYQTGLKHVSSTQETPIKNITITTPIAVNLTDIHKKPGGVVTLKPPAIHEEFLENLHIPTPKYNTKQHKTISATSKMHITTPIDVSLADIQKNPGGAVTEKPPPPHEGLSANLHITTSKYTTKPNTTISATSKMHTLTPISHKLANIHKKPSGVVTEKPPSIHEEFLDNLYIPTSNSTTDQNKIMFATTKLHTHKTSSHKPKTIATTELEHTSANHEAEHATLHSILATSINKDMTCITCKTEDILSTNLTSTEQNVKISTSVSPSLISTTARLITQDKEEHKESQHTPITDQGEKSITYTLHTSVAHEQESSKINIEHTSSEILATTMLQTTTEHQKESDTSDIEYSSSYLLENSTTPTAEKSTEQNEEIYLSSIHEENLSIATPYTTATLRNQKNYASSTISTTTEHYEESSEAGKQHRSSLAQQITPVSGSTSRHISDSGHTELEHTLSSHGYEESLGYTSHDLNTATLHTITQSKEESDKTGLQHILSSHDENHTTGVRQTPTENVERGKIDNENTSSSREENLTTLHTSSEHNEEGIKISLEHKSFSHDENSKTTAYRTTVEHKEEGGKTGDEDTSLSHVQTLQSTTEHKEGGSKISLEQASFSHDDSSTITALHTSTELVEGGKIEHTPYSHERSSTITTLYTSTEQRGESDKTDLEHTSPSHEENLTTLHTSSEHKEEGSKTSLEHTSFTHEEILTTTMLHATAEYKKEGLEHVSSSHDESSTTTALHTSTEQREESSKTELEYAPPSHEENLSTLYTSSDHKEEGIKISLEHAPSSHDEHSKTAAHHTTVEHKEEGGKMGVEDTSPFHVEKLTTLQSTTEHKGEGSKISLEHASYSHDDSSTISALYTSTEQREEGGKIDFEHTPYSHEQSSTITTLHTSTEQRGESDKTDLEHTSPSHEENLTTLHTSSEHKEEDSKTSLEHTSSTHEEILTTAILHTTTEYKKEGLEHDSSSHEEISPTTALHTSTEQRGESSKTDLEHSPLSHEVNLATLHTSSEHNEEGSKISLEHASSSHNENSTTPTQHTTVEHEKEGGKTWFEVTSPSHVENLTILQSTKEHNGEGSKISLEHSSYSHNEHSTTATLHTTVEKNENGGKTVSHVENLCTLHTTIEHNEEGSKTSYEHTSVSHEENYSTTKLHTITHHKEGSSKSYTPHESSIHEEIATHTFESAIEHTSKSDHTNLEHSSSNHDETTITLTPKIVLDYKEGSEASYEHTSSSRGGIATSSTFYTTTEHQDEGSKMSLEHTPSAHEEISTEQIHTTTKQRAESDKASLAYASNSHEKILTMLHTTVEYDEESAKTLVHASSSHDENPTTATLHTTVGHTEEFGIGLKHTLPSHEENFTTLRTTVKHKEEGDNTNLGTVALGTTMQHTSINGYSDSEHSSSKHEDTIMTPTPKIVLDYKETGHENTSDHEGNTTIASLHMTTKYKDEGDKIDLKHTSYSHEPSPITTTLYTPTEQREESGKTSLEHASSSHEENLSTLHSNSEHDGEGSKTSLEHTSTNEEILTTLMLHTTAEYKKEGLEHSSSSHDESSKTTVLHTSTEQRGESVKTDIEHASPSHEENLTTFHASSEHKKEGSETSLEHTSSTNEEILTTIMLHTTAEYKKEGLEHFSSSHDESSKTTALHTSTEQRGEGSKTDLEHPPPSHEEHLTRLHTSSEHEEEGSKTSLEHTSSAHEKILATSLLRSTTEYKKEGLEHVSSSHEENLTTYHHITGDDKKESTKINLEDTLSNKENVYATTGHKEEGSRTGLEHEERSTTAKLHPYPKEKAENGTINLGHTSISHEENSNMITESVKEYTASTHKENSASISVITGNASESTKSHSDHTSSIHEETSTTPTSKLMITTAEEGGKAALEHTSSTQEYSTTTAMIHTPADHKENITNTNTKSTAVMSKPTLEHKDETNISKLDSKTERTKQSSTITLKSTLQHRDETSISEMQTPSFETTAYHVSNIHSSTEHSTLNEHENQGSLPHEETSSAPSSYHKESSKHGEDSGPKLKKTSTVIYEEESEVLHFSTSQRNDTVPTLSSTRSTMQSTEIKSSSPLSNIENESINRTLFSNTSSTSLINQSSAITHQVSSTETSDSVHEDADDVLHVSSTTRKTTESKHTSGTSSETLSSHEQHTSSIKTSERDTSLTKHYQLSSTDNAASLHEDARITTESNQSSVISTKSLTNHEQQASSVTTSTYGTSLTKKNKQLSTDNPSPVHEDASDVFHFSSSTRTSTESKQSSVTESLSTHEDTLSIKMSEYDTSRSNSRETSVTSTESLILTDEHQTSSVKISEYGITPANNNALETSTESLLAANGQLTTSVKISDYGTSKNKQDQLLFTENPASVHEDASDSLHFSSTPHTSSESKHISVTSTESLLSTNSQQKYSVKMSEGGASPTKPHQLSSTDNAASVHEDASDILHFSSTPHASSESKHASVTSTESLLSTDQQQIYSVKISEDGASPTKPHQLSSTESAALVHEVASDILHFSSTPHTSSESKHASVTSTESLLSTDNQEIYSVKMHGHGASPTKPHQLSSAENAASVHEAASDALQFSSSPRTSTEEHSISSQSESQQQQHEQEESSMKQETNSELPQTSPSKSTTELSIEHETTSPSKQSTVGQESDLSYSTHGTLEDTRSSEHDINSSPKYTTSTETSSFSEASPEIVDFPSTISSEESTTESSTFETEVDQRKSETVELPENTAGNILSTSRSMSHVIISEEGNTEKHILTSNVLPSTIIEVHALTDLLQFSNTDTSEYTSQILTTENSEHVSTTSQESSEKVSSKLHTIEKYVMTSMNVPSAIIEINANLNNFSTTVRDSSESAELGGISSSDISIGQMEVTGYLKPTNSDHSLSTTETEEHASIQQPLQVSGYLNTTVKGEQSTDNGGENSSSESGSNVEVNTHFEGNEHSTDKLYDHSTPEGEAGKQSSSEDMEQLGKKVSIGEEHTTSEIATGGEATGYLKPTGTILQQFNHTNEHPTDNQRATEPQLGTIIEDYLSTLDPHLNTHPTQPVIHASTDQNETRPTNGLLADVLKILSSTHAPLTNGASTTESGSTTIEFGLSTTPFIRESTQPLELPIINDASDSNNVTTLSVPSKEANKSSIRHGDLQETSPSSTSIEENAFSGAEPSNYSSSSITVSSEEAEATKLTANTKLRTSSTEIGSRESETSATSKTDEINESTLALNNPSEHSTTTVGYQISAESIYTSTEIINLASTVRIHATDEHTGGENGTSSSVEDIYDDEEYSRTSEMHAPEEGNTYGLSKEYGGNHTKIQSSTHIQEEQTECSLKHKSTPTAVDTTCEFTIIVQKGTCNTTPTSSPNASQEALHESQEAVNTVKKSSISIKKSRSEAPNKYAATTNNSKQQTQKANTVSSISITNEAQKDYATSSIYIWPRYVENKAERKESSSTEIPSSTTHEKQTSTAETKNLTKQLSTIAETARAPKVTTTLKVEIYIDLPTYFPNSTVPVPNFEKIYTTEQKRPNLNSDKLVDVTLNPNEFRSMRHHDFDAITEFKTSTQGVSVSAEHDAKSTISKIREAEDANPISSSTGGTSVDTERSSRTTSSSTTTTHSSGSTYNSTTDSNYSASSDSTPGTSYSGTTNTRSTTKCTTVTCPSQEDVASASVFTLLHFKKKSSRVTDMISTTTSTSTENSPISRASTGEDITTNNITTIDITKRILLLFKKKSSHVTDMTSTSTSTSTENSPISAESLSEKITTYNISSSEISDGALANCSFANKDKETCLCSVDILVKDLQEKCISKNLNTTLDSSMCEKYIPLKTSGITLGKQHKRSKRNAAYYDDSSTVAKREIISNNNIAATLARDFSFSNADYHRFATPGSKVRIPCAEGKNITSKGHTITWTTEDYRPLTEGKIQESGSGYLTIDNVVAQDGGNYTCTVSNNSTGIRTFKHQLSVITLPIFDVNTTILYQSDGKCSNEDADIMEIYFSTDIANLICGKDHRICAIEVQRLKCSSTKRDNYLYISVVYHMEPINVILPTLNVTQCDVACQLKIYGKLVSVVVNNLQVFETQPVMYKLKRDVTLSPTRNNITSNETTDSPKLIIRCPPGFGLLEDKHICIACPRNTFSRGMEAYCTPCPKGQFQPMAGSKLCLECRWPLQDPHCFADMIFDYTKYKMLVYGVVACLVLLVMFICCLRCNKCKSKPAVDGRKKRGRRTPKKNRKYRKNSDDVEMQELLYDDDDRKSKRRKKGDPPSLPPPDF